MVGDAISHAVLLGVVIGFLVTGSTHFTVSLVGALIAAMLCMSLIRFLQITLKVHRDAALGLSFTSFFALGVILIARYTQKVDLDQGCVLYGQLIGTLFDQWSCYGYLLGPQSAYWLLALLLLNTTIIWLIYPTLLAITFDRDNAQVIGIYVSFWEYVLIVMTSLVAVASFKIVGAPLVIAFFILPPASAYFLTHQVSKLLFSALIIDALATIYGYQLAFIWNLSIPGSIVVIASMLFGLAFLTSKLVKKFLPA